LSVCSGILFVHIIPGEWSPAVDHAIWAEGLVKRFGETTALNGVDLAVRTGSVFGLLGPNGAGKTTAVRILATLLRMDEGRATVGGYDVATQAHQVRQLIGLTGQYASVDETLTGVENLLLIGRLLGMPKREAKARARELLADFGLTESGGRAAKTYSGGMRRRLDLAASLVGRPRILYLDEPTTGLDPRARLELWDLLRDLVARGVTILLTTQYLDEADALADEIAVIDHGRVIANGTPDELKAKTGAQTLAVRPADGAGLPVVQRVVTELTGMEPEVQGSLVTAPVTEPSVLSAAVRRLDEAGVLLAELQLRSSSLDEVFLSLTGRPAEEAPATESEEVSA
jgi:oleandomycin transport system ATP-binding protein